MLKPVTEIESCLPNQAAMHGALRDSEVAWFTTVFKALAHPVRLRMVDLIHRGGGDICVCEFENYFDLKQPTISHHLKILRDAGLIRSRQDGTWVRHSIEKEIFLLAQQLLQSLAAEPEPA